MRIGPPPSGGSASSLIVTGVPWRTGWRYRERGWRHIYWDAGTMLSHVLALADAQGLGASLYTTFPDASVSELVGADGAHEFPVAIVSLGGDPALLVSAAAAPGDLDHDAVVFPLATAAQRAGDADALGFPISRGEPLDVPPAGAVPLNEVLLARSSYRRLDPHRSLPRASLTAAMAVALRGVDVPHFVVVNAVDGIDPGVYRWPDLDTPLRRGNLRGELYQASITQGLPRDAAYVVISAIDAAALNDQRYRQAQLLAGLVEGRLHILAQLMHAGANGMTFQDSDVPSLLGDTGLRDLVCLLWTCVGVPEYTAKPGGLPAAPTTIRIVNPREDDGPDIPPPPQSDGA